MIADPRTASTSVRAVAIVLSVAWLVVLAWFPGQWIVQLWHKRDRSE